MLLHKSLFRSFRSPTILLSHRWSALQRRHFTRPILSFLFFLSSEVSKSGSDFLKGSHNHVWGFSRWIGRYQISIVLTMLFILIFMLPDDPPIFSLWNMVPEKKKNHPHASPFNFVLLWCHQMVASREKNQAPPCSPARLLFCVSSVWCQTSSFKAFPTENSCLPRLTFGNELAKHSY